MIPIPSGIHYTVNATGKVWKGVRCGQCHTEFFYAMERSAKGTGTSLLFVDNQGAQERARQQAAQDLQSQLVHSFDAVPCPNCGQFQDHMISTVRWAHRRWLLVLGLSLLAVGIVFFGLYYLVSLNSSYTDEVLKQMRFCLAMGTGCGAAGLALVIIKGIMFSRYDPNNAGEFESRVRLAKSRTMSTEQLQKMLQESAQGTP